MFAHGIFFEEKKLKRTKEMAQREIKNEKKKKVPKCCYY